MDYINALKSIGQAQPLTRKGACMKKIAILLRSIYFTTHTINIPTTPQMLFGLAIFPLAVYGLNSDNRKGFQLVVTGISSLPFLYFSVKKYLEHQKTPYNNQSNQ